MILASVDEPSFLFLGGIALWLRMEHRLTQVEDKIKVLEKDSDDRKPSAEKAAQDLKKDK
jgi:hypothetical protein